MLPGWDRLQELRQNKLDRHLSDAIEELKPETKMPEPTPLPPVPKMVDEPIKKNMSGASLLGDKLKATIEAARKEIEAAHGEAEEAASDIVKAAGHAKGIAKALKQEAADLKASIGQYSNMPE